MALVEEKPMKYTGWTRRQMIGELVLRCDVIDVYHVKTASIEELQRMLVSTEPAGTDWEEPDAESGRF